MSRTDPHDSEEFEPLRSRRPETGAPSEAAVRAARERLMSAIAQEQASRETGPAQPAEGVTVLRPGAGRRRFRMVLAAASVAAVAAVGVGVVASNDASTPHQSLAISPSGTPRQTLETAARLVAYTTAPGQGSIRHVRFKNLTDPGAPTYDRYVRPDGSAMVGEVGHRLEASDGYIPSSTLAGLPSDTTQLRTAMLAMSKRLGYRSPGEAPERGVFRLAIDLLSDPGVSPQVKGGVYRVIEHFDLTAIKARTLGRVKDASGRRGIGLELHFEEDATETIVLDPHTGALLSDVTKLSDGSFFSGQVYLSQQRTASIPRGAA